MLLCHSTHSLKPCAADKHVMIASVCKLESAKRLSYPIQKACLTAFGSFFMKQGDRRQKTVQGMAAYLLLIPDNCADSELISLLLL